MLLDKFTRVQAFRHQVKVSWTTWVLLMWPFVYMARLSSGSIYDGWVVGLEVAPSLLLFGSEAQSWIGQRVWILNLKQHRYTKTKRILLVVRPAWRHATPNCAWPCDLRESDQNHGCKTYTYVMLSQSYIQTIMYVMLSQLYSQMITYVMLSLGV